MQDHTTSPSYFDTLDGGPIDLDALMAFHRARFAGWSMEDDGSDVDDEAEDGKDGKEDADDDGDEPDWKARFEAQQRINKSLERKTKKDAATIANLTGKKPAGGGKTGGAKDDEVPDVDQIRAEAKAEAEREALNGRIEDKIEAKARAFADPEDAVAVLLRSHKYDDFLDANNKIDVEAITEALQELGEKKPHLLAQGGRFQGGGDGGARKESKGRAKSLGEAISRHYEKS